LKYKTKTSKYKLTKNNDTMKLQNNMVLGILALSAALTSCSSDEPAGSVNNDSTDAITVEAYVPRSVSSRAGIEDFESLQSETGGIGVFAYYHDGKEFKDYTSEQKAGAANFMSKQAVKYNGTTWAYSPIRYWSKTETDKYQFIAYAPLEKANANLNVTASPKLEYDAAKSNYDFMTAVQKDYVKPTDKIVKFNFRHRTSRIGITAKTDVDYSTTDKGGVTINVTSAVLKGFCTNGTYDLIAPVSDTQSAYYSSTAGWTLGETQPESYTALASTDTAKELTTTAASMFNDEGSLFAIPNDTKTKISVDITYEIVQGDVKYTETATLSRDNFIIQMGHAYTFNITIGLDAINFTVETIDAWGEGDGLNDTL
jgi:hypothetical protein